MRHRSPVGLSPRSCAAQAPVCGPPRLLHLVARAKPIKCDSNDSRARERLASDLDPFCGKFELPYENARDVASGARQIRHISLRQRVEIDGQKRDRLTVRSRERSTQRALVPDRQEHVNLARCELAIVLLVTFDIRCLDIIKCKVAAFLIAEFGHPLEKIGIERGLSGLNANKADTQHLGLLLCARRERPSRYRAAECGQQLPPSDGDCHTPLPCEVRKENDTTSRARSLAVQGGQNAGCFTPVALP